MSDELEKVFDDFADAAEKSLLGFREEIRSLRVELEQLKTETRNAPVTQPTPIREPIDGKDGLGVAGVSIREAGDLVFLMSDGTEKNVGRVVGNDGKPGRDGVDGKNGTNGIDGKNGIDGMNGKDGERGTDGRDGTGIAEVSKRNGELVIRLTDNTERNLGRIEAIDGAPGEKGERGEDGIATREEIESLVKSEVETRFADVQVRTIADSYQDVYKAGQTYSRGVFATWDGSLWLSLRDTNAQPGTNDSGWKLVTKRGRDGRDKK